MEKYTYRGFPCANNIWYIGGNSKNSSGVLEWCVSEDDAQYMLEKMSNYSEFSNLRIGNLEDEDYETLYTDENMMNDLLENNI